MRKIAVITGGASGIGLGCAKRLAAAGDKIALFDVRPDTLGPAVKALQKCGAKAIGCIADMSDRAQVNEAMGETRAPGGVDLARMAAMTPVRRVGTPDDVGAACAFLCSDDAGFITGQQINLNGGLYSG